MRLHHDLQTRLSMNRRGPAGRRGEQGAVFDKGVILRPGQLRAHDSAFATTVHRGQRSEFDAVALVSPETDASICTRELLYIGITRARNQALPWGSAERVRDAVGRRTWRDSGLEIRLRGAEIAL